MTGAESGYLLLMSRLGEPERKPLSLGQLRMLHKAISGRAARSDEELTLQHLLEAGLKQELAQRVLDLLEDTLLLHQYLSHSMGCQPITRISDQYPPELKARMNLDCPGILWARGDLSILNSQKIALVGSRDLLPENRAFAKQVGICAAEQGITLVSGNARGADTTAQEACLSAGGQVISIVADELIRHPPRDHVLYISEDGYDEAFTSQRAHSRNRTIHALGMAVMVAQCTYGSGGTWSGTLYNLRNRLTRVCCFSDSSPAAAELMLMGAELVDFSDLHDLRVLASRQQSLFDLH